MATATGEHERRVVKGAQTSSSPVRTRRRATARAVLAVPVCALVCVLASVGLAAAWAPAALAAATVQRPLLEPPVIVETFTLLACDSRTTLGIEGCLEHRTIVMDRRIDRDIALLFRLLHTDGERRRLVAAQESWIAYRQADCRSQADANAGGTLAGVDAATCELRDSTARHGDLRAFYLGLEEGAPRAPVFP